VKPLVVLALVLALLTPTSPAPAADRAAASDVVVLDGVEVRLRAGTRQVVTVNHTRGHHARVALHVLGERGWREVRATTDGRTGYGGLVPGARRRQGTGTTPLGTYALPSTFGAHPRQPAWTLPHRRIRRGDFWVQDNASDHYNRYRNQRQGGFRWWLPTSHPDSSERLTDYGRQYEMVVVMDFNPDQVRHRGSGIFLHVNGRGATAGCVSAPRPFLAMLMVRLDPAAQPVIAVGR
jgi:L,D-peptidoglycan transpeptidase YkuD (ErfK/YbiS/YcfS/YnhG family)